MGIGHFCTKCLEYDKSRFDSFLQLAAVAALCVQYEAEFRPNMSIVVKALSPLLVNKQVLPPVAVPLETLDA